MLEILLAAGVVIPVLLIVGGAFRALFRRVDALEHRQKLIGEQMVWLEEQLAKERASWEEFLRG